MRFPSSIAKVVVDIRQLHRLVCRKLGR